MKRLRDMDNASPLIEKAQALIDAVEPVPESRERMLRVRRELDRPRGALAGLRRLPALVLAALVALFGASALAAVRYLAARPEPIDRVTIPANAAPAKHVHRGSEHDESQPLAAPVAQPTLAPDAVQPATARPATLQQDAVQPNPVSARQVPAAASDDAAPALAPHARAVPRGRGSSSAQRSTKTTAHTTAPRAIAPRVEQHVEPPSEARVATNNSALVHRALKALRRDGDAALAASLLEENRKRYPDGPLAEEALSLQIEAALALNDPHARAFAREYLAHYPSGRYLTVAQRALEDATP